MIHRLTAAFLDLGLKKDDVILCQLYNSVPLSLTRLACEKAGLLVAIVGTKFRETEIAAVLGKTEAVGAVFPAQFRRFDFYRMFSDMQERFAHLLDLRSRMSVLAERGGDWEAVLCALRLQEDRLQREMETLHFLERDAEEEKDRETLMQLARVASERKDEVRRVKKARYEKSLMRRSRGKRPWEGSWLVEA